MFMDFYKLMKCENFVYFVYLLIYLHKNILRTSEGHNAIRKYVIPIHQCCQDDGIEDDLRKAISDT